MSVWIATTLSDGTDSQPLDTLGTVGAPVYSHALPGGCLACQFTLDLPVDANRAALTPGRLVTVYSGPLPVWTGVLDDPQRGTPWQLRAFGLSGLAKRFPALSSANTPTGNAQSAVTYAISQGLPWIDGGTIPSGFVYAASLTDLASLLDKTAAAAGQRWTVDAQRVLNFSTDPTGTPDLLISNVSTPGGRTVKGLATSLTGAYIDSTSGITQYATASTAATGTGPLGTYWDTIDLTNHGAVSAAAATSILTNILASEGARAQFSGALTVRPDQVLSAGGVQFTDLASLREGMLIRLLGISPEPYTGEIQYTDVLDIALGEVEYDAKSGLAKLTPLGAILTDLSSMLQATATLL